MATPPVCAGGIVVAGSEMQATRPLEGLRVLVVEDEATVALMIEDLLAECGAIVVGPAAEAAEALQLLAAGPVDCAIVDYSLVDGTSLPVADALMARGVPFLFASGYDPGGFDPRYAGVPRLEKIYTADELLQALANLLDRT
jgi:CheY-like chemotaxis protein